MSMVLAGTQIEAVEDDHTSPLTAELALAAELDEPLRLWFLIIDYYAVQDVALAAKFTHHALPFDP